MKLMEHDEEVKLKNLEPESFLPSGLRGSASYLSFLCELCVHACSNTQQHHALLSLNDIR